MKDKLTTRERIRHIFFAGLIVSAMLGLSGCIDQDHPDPTVKGYTDPYTGVHLIKDRWDNSTIKHEMKHVTRALAYGWYEWFDRYASDPVFACQEEIYAGSTMDTHSVCTNLTQEQQLQVAQEK